MSWEGRGGLTNSKCNGWIDGYMKGMCGRAHTPEFLRWLLLLSENKKETAPHLRPTKPLPAKRFYLLKLKLTSMSLNRLPKKKLFKDVSRILKATGNLEMVHEMGCRDCSSISTTRAKTAPETAAVAAKLTLNTRLEERKEQLFLHATVS